MGITKVGPTPQINLRGFAGEKKKRGIHISESVPALCRLLHVRLPDDRQNDAVDQVPVLADVDGNDRLDVQHILVAVILPDSESRVVLERNTDERSYWVLRGFCQGSRLCLVGFGGRTRGLIGCCCRRPVGAGAALCANADRLSKRIRESDNGKIRFITSGPLRLVARVSPWDLAGQFRPSRGLNQLTFSMSGIFQLLSSAAFSGP